MLQVNVLLLQLNASLLRVNVQPGQVHLLIYYLPLPAGQVNRQAAGIQCRKASYPDLHVKYYQRSTRQTYCYSTNR